MISPRRKAWLPLALIGFTVVSCGSSRAVLKLRSSPAKHVSPVVSLRQMKAPDGRITRLVGQLQSGYGAGSWGRIRDVFAGPRLAQSLITQMQTWKAERVQELHASLVSLQALAPGVSVGAVQFSADPRTIPTYAIYRFQRAGGDARIVGTDSGINGTWYRTATWSITHTKHFVVYHSPYLLHGADRSGLAGLEYQRRQFMREFGVKVASLTRYYWYPTQTMMAPLTRNTCGTNPDWVGCADPYPHPPEIHTSEWVSYHEPIHIYELAIEPLANPRSNLQYVAPLFIAEGTAVALEDRSADPRLSDYCSDLVYVPLDDCARPSISNLDPLSLLADRGFKRADAGDAYALGGSFVKYLILRYGFHQFGRFYYVLAAQPKDRESDYNVAGEKVYGQSIRQLLSAWKSQLCASGC